MKRGAGEPKSLPRRRAAARGDRSRPMGRGRGADLSGMPRPRNIRKIWRLPNDDVDAKRLVS
jgi:hypothetical protein